MKSLFYVHFACDVFKDCRVFGVQKVLTETELKIRTLGIQRQVLGPIWTLKHHRVLDLLHQQLQEVLPGCVAVLEAAGKWSHLGVFEAGRR